MLVRLGRLALLSGRQGEVVEHNANLPNSRGRRFNMLARLGRLALLSGRQGEVVEHIANLPRGADGNGLVMVWMRFDSLGIF